MGDTKLQRTLTPKHRYVEYVKTIVLKVIHGWFGAAQIRKRAELVLSGGERIEGLWTCHNLPNFIISKNNWPFESRNPV